MQDKIEALFQREPKLKDMLEFVFFEAVDASKNEHLNFKEHFAWWAEFLQGRALSDAEFACFTSHYKLWQECARLNEEIIILEDDVEFSENFNVLNLGKIQGSKYEYVRLRYTFEKKFHALDSNFYLSFKCISGAQGYFLRPSAALKFIKTSKKFIKPVDDSMDISFKNKVLNVVFKPLLITPQADIKSDIGVKRSFKIKPYKKILREIFRNYNKLRQALFALSVKRRLNLD